MVGALRGMDGLTEEREREEEEAASKEEGGARRSKGGGEPGEVLDQLEQLEPRPRSAAAGRGGGGRAGHGHLRNLARRAARGLRCLLCRARVVCSPLRRRLGRLGLGRCERACLRCITLGCSDRCQRRLAGGSRLSHLVVSGCRLSAKLPPDLCDGPRVARRQPSIGRFDRDPRQSIWVCYPEERRGDARGGAEEHGEMTALDWR
mmetsp:Transcript_49882/g.166726  ORF Transcript_49882/g.166726 Transcript_49882/m.166726 type:complete len:205 (+) Transcript_49882:1189-1803(+)